MADIKLETGDRVTRSGFSPYQRRGPVIPSLRNLECALTISLRLVNAYGGVYHGVATVVFEEDRLASIALTVWSHRTSCVGSPLGKARPSPCGIIAYGKGRSICVTL
jgi:hypothetical protein